MLRGRLSSANLGLVQFQGIGKVARENVERPLREQIGDGGIDTEILGQHFGWRNRHEARLQEIAA
jgi:hypothetical protein